MHEEALGCRGRRRHSIPGASDLCACVAHAFADAGDICHRGNHIQIRGAYERHRVVCDGGWGHRQVRPPVERQGGHERAGRCLPREQPEWRTSVQCSRHQVPRHRHRTGAVDRLLRRGLRQRGQGSQRVCVEGELALHHAEGARAAHPDSYAYDAYPDSDAYAYDPHAHSDSDAYAYDPHAHPDSDAYDPHASGYCPVRSGAVVLQHPGAELLRE
jgi:hypothetical protein